MHVVSIDGPSTGAPKEGVAGAPKPKAPKDTAASQATLKRAGQQKSKDAAQDPQSKPGKPTEPVGAGRSGSKSRGRASKQAAIQRLKESPAGLPVKPPKIEASKDYKPDSETKQVSIIEPETVTAENEVQNPANEAKKTDQRRKSDPRKKSVAQNPAPVVVQPKDKQQQPVVNTRKRGKSQPMDQNAGNPTHSGPQKSLEAKQGGKKDAKKAGLSTAAGEGVKAKPPRAVGEAPGKPGPKPKERATKKKADPRDDKEPPLHKTKRNASPHSRTKARAERASARHSVVAIDLVGSLQQQPAASKPAPKTGRSKPRKI